MRSFQLSWAMPLVLLGLCAIFLMDNTLLPHLPASPESNINKASTNMWDLLPGHKVVILHGAKTGGGSSKAFMRRCMGHVFTDNFLNVRSDVDPGVFEKNVLRFKQDHPGRPGVIVSHVYTEEDARRVFSSIWEDVVVVIPVRPWRSWLLSAVQQVGHRHCFHDNRTRTCSNANLSDDELAAGSCIIDLATLLKMLVDREVELEVTQQNIFAGLLHAQKQQMLNSQVFFFDFEKLSLLHDFLVEHESCPMNTQTHSPLENMNSLKKPMFVQSVANGACLPIEEMVDRNSIYFSVLLNGGSGGALFTWDKVLEDGFSEYVDLR